jgi:hypothetical protein
MRGEEGKREGGRAVKAKVSIAIGCIIGVGDCKILI